VVRSAPGTIRIERTHRSASGTTELRVMDADGGNARKLTAVGSSEQFGTWGPLP
jgi:hypothetical protein